MPIIECKCASMDEAKPGADRYTGRFSVPPAWLPCFCPGQVPSLLPLGSCPEQFFISTQSSLVPRTVTDPVVRMTRPTDRCGPGLCACRRGSRIPRNAVVSEVIH
jgi:hypothetical protein